MIQRFYLENNITTKTTTENLLKILSDDSPNLQKFLKMGKLNSNPLFIKNLKEIYCENMYIKTQTFISKNITIIQVPKQLLNVIKDLDKIKKFCIGPNCYMVKEDIIHKNSKKEKNNRIKKKINEIKKDHIKIITINNPHKNINLTKEIDDEYIINLKDKNIFFVQNEGIISLYLKNNKFLNYLLGIYDTKQSYGKIRELLKLFFSEEVL